MDTHVPKVLMPTWPVCAWGLPMRGRYANAQNFGPVTFDHGTMTFDLGGMTLTLCALDSDGFTAREAFADLVSFQVFVSFHCVIPLSKTS